MQTVAARLIAALALVLVLGLASAALVSLRQDLAFTAARTEVGFWGRPDYLPDDSTVSATGAAIDGLLQRAPGHPDYLALQAHYLVWRAYWQTDPAQRERLGKQALDAQFRSLQARPAHRQGWAKMVEYASRSRGGQDMLALARNRLALLEPGFAAAASR